MHVCSECGNQVSDKAKICPNCGCPIEYALKKPNKNRLCVECGYAIDYKLKVCPECGCPVEDDENLQARAEAGSGSDDSKLKHLEYAEKYDPKELKVFQQQKESQNEDQSEMKREGVGQYETEDLYNKEDTWSEFKENQRNAEPQTLEDKSEKDRLKSKCSISDIMIPVVIVVVFIFTIYIVNLYKKNEETPKESISGNEITNLENIQPILDSKQEEVKAENDNGKTTKAGDKIWSCSREYCRATITEVIGIDSDLSVIKYKENEDDIYYNCKVQHEDDKKEIAKCVVYMSSSENNDGLKESEIKANCVNREIAIGDNYNYKFVGRNKRVGEMQVAKYDLMDMKTGEILDGSTASNYPNVMLKYQMLCPKTAPDDIY